MVSRTALTLSIGILGGLAVALTAEVITVPIWVVFLAWASFFFVGGGVAGWIKSVSSNLAGVVIASASLYAAHLMGGSLLMAADILARWLLANLSRHASANASKASPTTTR